MTCFFVNKFVDNGLVEFEFGNNVNCQIGLVSVALPETEEDDETVSISCDQIDSTSLNPSRAIRHFYHKNENKYTNYEFQSVSYQTIDTTDKKLQIRFWDSIGNPLGFKDYNPRILLTFILKCDTNKKWIKR